MCGWCALPKSITPCTAQLAQPVNWNLWSCVCKSNTLSLCHSAPPMHVVHACMCVVQLYNYGSHNVYAFVWWMHVYMVHMCVVDASACFMNVMHVYVVHVCVCGTCICGACMYLVPMYVMYAWVCGACMCMWYLCICCMHVSGFFFSCGVCWWVCSSLHLSS